MAFVKGGEHCVVEDREGAERHFYTAKAATANSLRQTASRGHLYPDGFLHERAFRLSLMPMDSVPVALCASSASFQRSWMRCSRRSAPPSASFALGWGVDDFSDCIA